jgi:hypothetical protein
MQHQDKTTATYVENICNIQINIGPVRQAVFVAYKPGVAVLL